VVQNEINNMSFLISDTKSKMSKAAVSDQERKKMRRKGDRYSVQTSLIVAALRRLLPIGLNICAPGDQELIALAKNRLSMKDTEDEVRDIIRSNIHLQGKLEDPAIRWQMALYKDLPNRPSNRPVFQKPPFILLVCSEQTSVLRRTCVKQGEGNGDEPVLQTRSSCQA